jgi:hypothetical protein
MQAGALRRWATGVRKKEQWAEPEETAGKVRRRNGNRGRGLGSEEGGKEVERHKHRWGPTTSGPHRDQVGEREPGRDKSKGGYGGWLGGEAAGEGWSERVKKKGVGVRLKRGRGSKKNEKYE